MREWPDQIWTVKKSPWGTCLVVQWQDSMLPVLPGGLGLIPGQGTRSHMLKLRVHIPQLKIVHAATKIKDSTGCN